MNHPDILAVDIGFLNAVQQRFVVPSGGLEKEQIDRRQHARNRVEILERARMKTQRPIGLQDAVLPG